MFTDPAGPAGVFNALVTRPGRIAASKPSQTATRTWLRFDDWGPCSSGHDHRMPVQLFAHKSERCPYGHSLAPGMPQQILWLPYICDRPGKGSSRSTGFEQPVQEGAAWPGAVVSCPGVGASAVLLILTGG